MRRTRSHQNAPLCNQMVHSFTSKKAAYAAGMPELGGQGGAPPPDFCRSINPILNRGANYAPPPDFQTFLRPCAGKMHISRKMSQRRFVDVLLLQPCFNDLRQQKTLDMTTTYLAQNIKKFTHKLCMEANFSVLLL